MRRAFLLTLAVLLMALEVADGTITISTGAIGTTFTVSGLPFQPKALFFFWSGRATNGQGEADHKFGCGMAVSTASRRAMTTQSDHGNTNSVTDSVLYNDACVATLTIAGALDGKADLDAILSDGFRLIIDDVFSAALQVGWIAWGGSDISDVSITSFTAPGATGNQDINVGFALDTGADDKAIIIIGGGTVAENTIDTWSSFSLGAAAGNTPAGGTLSAASQDAIGTAITMSHCRAGECVTRCGADIVVERATLTTWLSTGFRLNWAEIEAGFSGRYAALAIKGGRWEVGNALTSTGTTNQTEATTYVPKGLLVVSHNKAQSSLDTTQAGDERSVGVATSSTSRRYASIIDKDAETTMDIGVAYNETQMYANQSTAATVVIEGLMDLVSFDATPGFTYVMDDADPTAAFFWYLAMGDAPAVALPPPPTILNTAAMRAASW